MPLSANADGTDFTLKYLEGTSRKKAPGSEGWLKLDSNSVIGIGDSVKTLEDGRLELQISDRLLRIGTGTLIAISDSNIEYNMPEKTIELISGELWSMFISKEDVNRGLLLPKANVYGGDFDARFSVGDDGTAEIKVYSGEADITRRLIPVIDSIETDDGADSTDITDHTPESWSVTLDSNEKLILSSSGEIIFRGPFSPDDPDEQTDWVRWNKDRAR